MTSFKKHYIESLQLTESPMRVGLSYGDYLDNRGVNVEEAQRIIKEYPHVLNFKRENLEYDLYRQEENSKIYDFWLTKQPFITCYYILKKKEDGGVQSLGVWNDKMYRSTARGLFFDYYLKNFPYVQSDNLHTKQGETFWKSLIAWAADKGHKVTVYDRDEQIEYDLDDAEGYWGNIEKFTDYTFKVYAK